MNKVSLLIITLLFLTTAHTVYAYAVTASASATQKPATTPKSTVSDQINDLKDRIASRVAQLKLVERRGIIGKVTEVTDTQITLTDLQNNVRLIDVDEITKFSSASAKSSFGISDITKGTNIGVLGLFNKQSRRILGRFIEVVIEPSFLHGIVSDIDSNNFTFTFKTSDNREVKVDVENTTKTLLYTKNGGFIKAGFSRIKQGEMAQVIGFYDVKNKNTVLANRILLFPEILTGQAVPEPTTTPKNETSKESSGSANR